MAREITNKLLDAVDGAGFDYVRHVLLCALKYMSEDEVRDMAHINGLIDEDEESPHEN